MYHGIEPTTHDIRQLRHAIPRPAQANAGVQSVQRSAFQIHRLCKGVDELARQLTALQDF
jgi:hypothetical protein